MSLISGIPTTGLDTTFDYLVFLFGPSLRNMDFSPTHDYANFPEMWADYERRGTITVNTQHSDKTIFSTPHLNHCFRYWHDLCHIKAKADFTAEGEAEAAWLQMQQVRKLKGNFSIHDLDRWCAIIDTEVNGQTRYYMEHGDFPVDQRAFAIEDLTRKGYDVSQFPHTLDGLIIEY